MKQARFFFNKVIDEFPKSLQAHRAQQRITHMVNNQN